MSWSDQGTLGDDWSMSSVFVALGQKRCSCITFGDQRSSSERSGISLSEKRCWCGDGSLGDQ
ncbi:hypothetical protein WN48_09254 [Eufriesea mexicana]|nr:hypothetical protein WN48_09254 [Eufriesea mexicana]